MSSSATIAVVGGIGLFLLGVHHLTEGLKGLAGDSLRRALQTLVSGRLSAVVSGALFTVAIQSSTATTLTVIGFVSAGLVSFSQAVGVIVGATFGTTSTPWLVAIFGFRLRVALFAMPMIGIGALLWLIAKGKARSLGAIVAGFGLLFIGIEYLQDGMKGVSWNLDAFAGTGIGARWLLAGIGILMSVVMQSSSAAAATTLVALHAGSLTFEQGCAMIVGQSVGTTATSALMMVGGGLAVRRAALAHIVYSLGAGIIGLLLLRPIAAAAGWVGGQFEDYDGVLALAAFSTLFKLAGVIAVFPWLGSFSRFIAAISSRDGDTAVSRLDPTLAGAGGTVALEAAWRAILELARDAANAVRCRLSGEPLQYDLPAEAVERTERFLESLSLETLHLGAFEPRLVRLAHALDHLRRLCDDLARAPPAGGQIAASLAAGAEALAAWLGATINPALSIDPAVFKSLEAASARLAADYKSRREQVLEDVALQRISTAAARDELDALAWADSALYHAWRLVRSLEMASGNQPAAS